MPSIFPPIPVPQPAVGSELLGAQDSEDKAAAANAESYGVVTPRQEAPSDDPAQNALNYLMRHCGSLCNSAPGTPNPSVQASPSKAVRSQPASREHTPGSAPRGQEGGWPRARLATPDGATVSRPSLAMSLGGGLPTTGIRWPFSTMHQPQRPAVLQPSVPFPWLEEDEGCSALVERPRPIAKGPIGDRDEEERLARTAELLAGPLEGPPPLLYALRMLVGGYLTERCGVVDRLQVRYEGPDAARITAEFATAEGAHRCLRLPPATVRGLPLVAQPARTAISVTHDPDGRVGRTVCVYTAAPIINFNLQDAVEWLESRCGPVTRQLLFPHKGYALVEFDHELAATSAIRHSGGLVHSVPLGVERHIAPILSTGIP